MLLTGKPQQHAKSYCWWAMLALEDFRLTAGPDAAVACSVSRPAGWQVWNHPVASSVHVPDYGDPCEPLGPISIVGVRNGAHSGQVVLGCDGPVEGVKAQVSAEPPAGGRAIPPGACQVRYGLVGQVADWHAAARYSRGVLRFEGLGESPRPGSSRPRAPAA